jgi:uncharacterized RDD family membrane protein YckC
MPTRRGCMLSDVATTSGSDVKSGDRIVAFAIDGAALALVHNVLFFGLNLEIWMGLLLSFALWHVYFGWYWSGLGGGQTPGKRLFELRVLSESGAMLDLRHAVIRSLVLYFGSFLAIAPFSVLLSKDGRGVHDRAAGSRVVRVARHELGKGV